MERAARVFIRNEAEAEAFLGDRYNPRIIVRGEKRFVVESAACGRCGGGGYYGPTVVEGGRCFECRGINTRDRVVHIGYVAWAKKKRAEELACARRAETMRLRRERALESERDWCAANTKYGRVTYAERDELRAAEREAERIAAIATKKHVGVVGARTEMTLTVRFWVDFDGYYGTTRLYLMEDADGNSVNWMASSGGLRDDNSHVEKGETVVVKATVKEHRFYKMVPETRVTRVKLVRIERATELAA